MDAAIRYLKGVGPKLAERLQKIGINTAQDLLFHLPSHYQDRTRIIPLGRARPGMQVTVEGTVELTEVIYRKKRQLLCRLHDGTGFLTLRFFHFNKMQQKNLERGVRLRCFGEIRYGGAGYEMFHPEYYRIDPENPLPVEKNLTPIYPTTEGLHQKTFRKIIPQALQLLQHDARLQELLPQKILEQYNFPNLFAALLYIHNPPTNADIKLLENKKHHYQQRLIFEELLAHHLSLRNLRKKIRYHQAVTLPISEKIINKFIAQLPFKLTNAQRKVIAEIKDDLNKSSPMLRLLQGDVGSGKTVVAAYAALTAVVNHYQAAVMAPTELLAEQHYKNFLQWLRKQAEQPGSRGQQAELRDDSFTGSRGQQAKPRDDNSAIVLLTGSLKGKARAKVLEKIKTGEAQIIIGTHALFQEDVEFKNLSLVIVDEQHRFGVHQRLTLRSKGAKNNFYPHQLIMTATPIPRTLAMSAYADLDHSIIDELPPGRKPVTTVAVSNLRRAEVLERIKKACKAKHQVYWICTLIEESENLQAQAAEKTAQQLKQCLPELKIALVHGRMKSNDKEKIMCAFKQGEIDLLVATTVVEVGVDVPNASLMVIENPERLGLAQLHQLRGRIGRGTKQSHCVLLYQDPLSHYARERIKIMRETNDGFLIAQKDLELRGPGEVLGTRQAGILQLRIADIMRDRDFFPQVKTAAALVMNHYPKIIKPLITRWIIHPEDYGCV
ncbi:MAG: ATP-dependent DNA helicase RecG [Gammaproteobacteria bacterium]|jgi:ATP-dependent DNA helicase RecG